jgi:hypothetical protein
MAPALTSSHKQHYTVSSPSVGYAACILLIIMKNNWLRAALTIIVNLWGWKTGGLCDARLRVARIGDVWRR